MLSLKSMLNWSQIITCFLKGRFCRRPFLIHSDFRFLGGAVHLERQLLFVHLGVPCHVEPLEHTRSSCDRTSVEGSAVKTPRRCRGLIRF